MTNRREKRLGGGGRGGEEGREKGGRVEGGERGRNITVGEAKGGGDEANVGDSTEADRSYRANWGGSRVGSPATVLCDCTSPL